MLKLHCLAYSRAIRAAWLLEEVGAPHELILYERTERFLAPEALKAVHPLGKSPVLETEGLKLAESSAILRWIDAVHGGGRFQPEPASPAFFEHAEWLDYVESSAAAPILAAVFARIAGRSDGPEDPRMKAELEIHLDHIAARLADRPFLMGERPMLADIQMSYMIALVELAGRIESRPALAAYWRRLQDLPGFRAAVARTGPMTPPPG